MNTSLRHLHYCLQKNLYGPPHYFTGYKNKQVRILQDHRIIMEPTFTPQNVYVQTYKQAIDMHKSGVNEKEILHYIAKAAETASGHGSAVSILLLDKEGLLRNGASPQLPGDYLQAIDGLKPNADVGTCAAAAATGKIVMTPSFYADNKWAELRHLPLSLGYVGAWSVPIKNDDKIVLGTFGTYLRYHRHPSDEEVEGIELLAKAVAIVFAGCERTVQ